MFTLNEAVKAGIVVEGEKLKKLKNYLKKNKKELAFIVGGGALGGAVGGYGLVKGVDKLSKMRNKMPPVYPDDLLTNR